MTDRSNVMPEGPPADLQMPRCLAITPNGVCGERATVIHHVGDRREFFCAEHAREDREET